jgi:hypothetical protein
MERKTVKAAIDLPESFLEDYADFKALQTYIRQHRKCGDVFLPTNEAISKTGIISKSPYFGVLGIIERYFRGNICAPMEKSEPRLFVCNYEKPKY